jgi:hypothetical protein
MPKNQPPLPGPKCRKPVHFLPAKTGGRKFRRTDCYGGDPASVPERA